LENIVVESGKEAVVKAAGSHARKISSWVTGNFREDVSLSLHSKTYCPYLFIIMLSVGTLLHL
jgi:hypothetical protein